MNISKGGMNVELPEAPVLGAPLRVILVLPSGPPVAIDGFVRHVTAMPSPSASADFLPRFQVGVEFHNLDGEKRAYLEENIRKHAAG